MVEVSMEVVMEEEEEERCFFLVARFARVALSALRRAVLWRHGARVMRRRSRPRTHSHARGLSLSFSLATSVFFSRDVERRTEGHVYERTRRRDKSREVMGACDRAERLRERERERAERAARERSIR